MVRVHAAALRVVAVLAALSFALLFHAPQLHADAPFTGDLPQSGVGLVVWNGGTVAEMAEAAPDAGSFWVTVDGQMVGYIAGAPDFVNAEFLERYADDVPAGTPLLVRMRELPVPDFVMIGGSDGCTRPPREALAALQSLSLPDGFCFRERRDPSERVGYDFVRKGTIVLGPNGDSALSATCTAHLHHQVLSDASLSTRKTETFDEVWMLTPAGGDFMARTGWRHDGTRWVPPGDIVDVYGSWGEGHPWVDATNVCAAWYDARSDFSWDKAQRRHAWAERWLSPAP